MNRELGNYPQKLDYFLSVTYRGITCHIVIVAHYPFLDKNSESRYNETNCKSLGPIIIVRYLVATTQ